MSKDEGGRNSSLSEKPVRSRPRRLADWINPTGAKKVHSLIDKVYKRKNLEMAWEKVKENRGSGGVDGQSLEAFEAQLNQQLDRLHRELAERAEARKEFEFERVVSCGQRWRTQLNFRRREPFDDGHRGTTLRTAPSVAELGGGSTSLELLLWRYMQ